MEHEIHLHEQVIEEFARRLESCKTYEQVIETAIAYTNELSTQRCPQCNCFLASAVLTTLMPLDYAEHLGRTVEEFVQAIHSVLTIRQQRIQMIAREQEAIEELGLLVSSISDVNFIASIQGLPLPVALQAARDYVKTHPIPRNKMN